MSIVSEVASVRNALRRFSSFKSFLDPESRLATGAKDCIYAGAGSHDQQTAPTSCAEVQPHLMIGRAPRRGWSDNESADVEVAHRRYAAGRLGSNVELYNDLYAIIGKF